jgi:hypothetical protein
MRLSVNQYNDHMPPLTKLVLLLRYVAFVFRDSALLFFCNSIRSCQAKICLLCVFVIHQLFPRLSSSHSIKPISKELLNGTLDPAVRGNAAVNGCNLKAMRFSRASNSAPLYHTPPQYGRLKDWEILSCQRQKWDWICKNPAPPKAYSRRAEIVKAFEEYKNNHPEEFEH